MNTSDVIAVVAVAMSLLSVLASVFIYLNQKKYIATQDSLNKILLQKEKAELNSETAGDVSANVVHFATNQYRIRVFNKGKGRANDVHIEYPEDHDWAIMDQLFPLEFLDPGQSVDLNLALMLGSMAKSLSDNRFWV